MPLTLDAGLLLPLSLAGLVGLPAGSFLASSHGVQVTDLDGNAFYDLGGSYGVNLLGYDFYKGCMERGARRVGALGPVLGSYPSLVADNAARLARISGKDEVW